MNISLNYDLALRPFPHFHDLFGILFVTNVLFHNLDPARIFQISCQICTLKKSTNKTFQTAKSLNLIFFLIENLKCSFLDKNDYFNIKPNHNFLFLFHIQKEKNVCMILQYCTYL